MGKVVNKAELEEIVGISHTTLTEYQEEGLPVAKRGARGQEHEYDSAEVITWLINRALARAGKAESQRERLARLQADRAEFELEKDRKVHVPTEEVEPVWKTRVLSAAALMLTRQSRLAGLLEATEGVEAKRELLKREDAAFLTRLGANGEQLQAEMEDLLAKVSAFDAEAILRRVAGHDEQQGTAGPPGPGVAPVRPGGEGPPVGMG